MGDERKKTHGDVAQENLQRHRDWGMGGNTPDLTPDEKARIDQENAWSDTSMRDFDNIQARVFQDPYFQQRRYRGRRDESYNPPEIEPEQGIRNDENRAAHAQRLRAKRDPFSKAQATTDHRFVPRHPNELDRPVTNFTPGITTGPNVYQLERGQAAYDAQKKAAADAEAQKQRQQLDYKAARYNLSPGGMDDPFIRAKEAGDKIRRQHNGGDGPAGQQGEEGGSAGMGQDEDYARAKALGDKSKKPGSVTAVWDDFRARTDAARRAAGPHFDTTTPEQNAAVQQERLRQQNMDRRAAEQARTHGGQETGLPGVIKGVGDAALSIPMAPIMLMQDIKKRGLGPALAGVGEGVVSTPGRVMDSLDPTSRLTSEERTRNIVEAGMMAAPVLHAGAGVSLPKAPTPMADPPVPKYHPQAHIPQYPIHPISIPRPELGNQVLVAKYNKARGNAKFEQGGAHIPDWTSAAEQQKLLDLHPTPPAPEITQSVHGWEWTNRLKQQEQEILHHQAVQNHLEDPTGKTPPPEALTQPPSRQYQIRLDQQARFDKLEAERVARQANHQKAVDAHNALKARIQKGSGGGSDTGQQGEGGGSAGMDGGIPPYKGEGGNEIETARNIKADQDYRNARALGNQVRSGGSTVGLPVPHLPLEQNGNPYPQNRHPGPYGNRGAGQEGNQGGSMDSAGGMSLEQMAAMQGPKAELQQQYMQEMSHIQNKLKALEIAPAQESNAAGDPIPQQVMMGGSPGDGQGGARTMAMINGAQDPYSGADAGGGANAGVQQPLTEAQKLDQWVHNYATSLREKGSQFDPATGELQPGDVAPTEVMGDPQAALQQGVGEEQYDLDALAGREEPETHPGAGAHQAPVASYGPGQPYPSSPPNPRYVPPPPPQSNSPINPLSGHRARHNPNAQHLITQPTSRGNTFQGATARGNAGGNTFQGATARGNAGGSNAASSAGMTREQYLATPEGQARASRGQHNTARANISEAQDAIEQGKMAADNQFYGTLAGEGAAQLVLPGIGGAVAKGVGRVAAPAVAAVASKIPSLVKRGAGAVGEIVSHVGNKQIGGAVGKVGDAAVSAATKAVPVGKGARAAGSAVVNAAKGGANAVKRKVGQAAEAGVQKLEGAAARTRPRTPAPYVGPEIPPAPKTGYKPPQQKSTWTAPKPSAAAKPTSPISVSDKSASSMHKSSFEEMMSKKPPAPKPKASTKRVDTSPGKRQADFREKAAESKKKGS